MKNIKETLEKLTQELAIEGWGTAGEWLGEGEGTGYFYPVYNKDNDRGNCMDAGASVEYVIHSLEGSKD